ncbi:hypothetical protein [Seonamhaeicola maritimus]|uniref:hypothetical protein n=1 Tax=Seonamhaeicola maritimus TaxID=2591822 RepID=UPI0024951563|nr:hypothetical protein [Seonamhaeicola maritimus]
MRNSCNLLLTVLLFLVFTLNLNAQEGFRAEVNIGPAIGDSKEYFSYALQGNFYYLWKLSESFDLGINAGAMVFMGDASESYCDGCLYDDYEPELYIPVTLAGRVNISKKWSLGLDAGYAFFVHVFDGGGGVYLRPVINYNLKEKIALVLSIPSITENESNSSSISLGINFGF